ncbi:HAD family hydrolase [Paenibacillus mesotrionivorans]|uniref:HAD family hydrolase n=1 Tax=Paenibacillus mesotrionivorans TaxID=3160968 RepID=A0ACC7P2D5_9BACL
MGVQVISLDMFQTLVNVNSRLNQIWGAILAEQFHPEKAGRHSTALQARFMEEWSRSRETEAFILLREIYGRSFEELFREYGIAYSHQEAAEILFREHRLAHFYEDTQDFLASVAGRYQLCITSDADDAMIPDFYRGYGARLFTSEQCLSYKNDSGNKIFKDLIRHYQVPPGDILHIGDSRSDVLGAKREGIAACWINRTGQTWEHELKPDYTVSSFAELSGILGSAG